MPERYTKPLLLAGTPEFVQKCNNPNYLSERTIVTPFNDAVDKDNGRILARLPGAQRRYLSVDTQVHDSQVVELPAEFLPSQLPSGIPSHVINLKVSAPIMLLRNLEALRICNRTQLIVKDLMPNVIRATIMTNCSIPSDIPIEFKMLQFTFHLSYAIAIKKSHGLTLKVASLDLLEPCF